MSCSLSHSINSVGGGGLRKEEVSPSAPPDLIEPNWMERFWCPAKSSALPPCTVTLFRGNQRTLLLHLVIRRRSLLGRCCTETVLIAFHYLNWELMPGFEKFIPISVYYTLLTIFMDYIILHACRDQLRGISGWSILGNYLHWKPPTCNLCFYWLQKQKDTDNNEKSFEFV